MRHRIPVFLLSYLLFLLPLGAQPAPNEAPRPDILLIMADDMGFSDPGCYGGEINTPNLDRLAAGGVRFTQFYNAARCCPTRASLLTGLYPHQVGMGGMVSAHDAEPAPGPYQGYLATEGCLTLAEALAPAGYRSYMSGKWHVGEHPDYWPHTRGFERYFGLISGASSYYELIADQPRLRQMALDSSRWEPPAEGFYMTDAITDHAVEWLQQHQRESPEQPFFLYVAYTAPHWPLHALPEDIERYQGRYDQGWDALRRERYERQRRIGLFDGSVQLSKRPGDIPPWDSIADRREWARRMEVYAAMVDRMDQGIGRLLTALRRSGRLDNTIILFLSDNGGCHEDISGRELHDPEAPIGARGSYVAYRRPWANASNTPFRLYKSWVHEGGSASPFVVHWPAGNLPGGAFIDQPAHIIDLMPTLLELAGATYPDTFRGSPATPLEGISLLPYLRGQRAVDRILFWEHFGNAAIRQSDWKLVRERDGDWELYDLSLDRAEQDNLIEEWPRQARAMQQLYYHWAGRVGVR